jgi:hypothetical protein
MCNCIDFYIIICCQFVIHYSINCFVLIAVHFALLFKIRSAFCCSVRLIILYWITECYICPDPGKVFQVFRSPLQQPSSKSINITTQDLHLLLSYDKKREPITIIDIRVKSGTNFSVWGQRGSCPLYIRPVLQYTVLMFIIHISP